MPRVLTVANQKGGTGKTTVTVNVAGALAAHHGLRTLVVDLDPQANATTGLVPPPYVFDATVYDVVMEPLPMEEARIEAGHPNLLLVPGSEWLRGIERDTDPGVWDRLVHDACPRLFGTIAEDVDLVLFDTPPNLGLWLQLALASSDGVLIVAKSEAFAVQGIQQLSETIESTRANVNPGLTVEGVVLNQVRSRTIEHSGFIEAYRERFGDLLLEPFLPQRIVTSSAQRAHQPLEIYQRQDRDGRGPARLYRELAAHLLPKESGGPGQGDVAEGAQEASRTPMERLP